MFILGEKDRPGVTGHHPPVQEEDVWPQELWLAVGLLLLQAAVAVSDDRQCIALQWRDPSAAGYWLAGKVASAEAVLVRMSDVKI